MLSLGWTGQVLALLDCLLQLHVPDNSTCARTCATTGYRMHALPGVLSDTRSYVELFHRVSREYKRRWGGSKVSTHCPVLCQPTS